MNTLFPMEVRGASTKRQGKRLVGPITLTVDGQKSCVVLGPNGSGKTSLLRMLHGIARLSEGEIRWACGKEAAHHAQAYVFQRPVMLRRSVIENLIFPLRLRGASRTTAREAALHWGKAVGLGHALERQASVLSGGEQQKLALARALTIEPELLFLDEPTAALDGRATREIEDILRNVIANGTRLFLATHDLGQARRLADHVFFMLGGRVHEAGDAARFFENPSTPEARAFLNGDIVE